MHVVNNNNNKLGVSEVCPSHLEIAVYIFTYLIVYQARSEIKDRLMFNCLRDMKHLEMQPNNQRIGPHRH